MTLKLSIIIPVHNGGENFRRCLEALAQSSRQPDQVIIVDDSSADASARIARDTGARVISLKDQPRGPAYARNCGAAQAQGDVLVFFDADVAVHSDTLGLFEKYLTNHLELAALFGSYDAQPGNTSVVSLYKNLMHHYVHQHSKRQAATFWTGCGAIRREVFEAVGGFDPVYTHPSIEDIELGMRLTRAGYQIWLCPEIQVTHLKCWTLVSLLRADILDRAIPWTRLILRSGNLPSDLNLNLASRLSALAVWGGLIGLFFGVWAPGFWLASLAAWPWVLLLNAELYHFFAQRGGIRFAIVAAGLHWLYLIYSSAVFGGMWLLSRLGFLRGD